MTDFEFINYIESRVALDPRGRFNAEEMARLVRLAKQGLGAVAVAVAAIASANTVDVPAEDAETPAS